MKNKFITLIMACVISTLVAVTVFASGWVEFEEGWKFEDTDGDFVSGEWRKSNDKWFYLNDDGFVDINKVVDYNDNYYFVTSDGSMVRNAWVFTTIDDEDAHWMFFQSTGKAYSSGWHEINGKRYHFTDSKMDYGFLDAEGHMIDEDNEDAWKIATYYCGTEDSGARLTNEWFLVDGATTNDDNSVWLYFSASGKKVVDESKTINGSKYAFDKDGSMRISWNTASSNSATPGTVERYYDENGALIEGSWIWTARGDDEDEHWYYAKSNGDILTNCIKMINGKRYAFDKDGTMLTGFVFFDSLDMIPTGNIKADDLNVNNWGVAEGLYYMYFAENEDPSLQGWALTNQQTICVNDEEHTFRLGSNGFATVDGYSIYKGKLYKNCVLITLEDVNYGEVNGYLINKSGSVKKNANGVKDGDCTKYWSDAEGKVTKTERY